MIDPRGLTLIQWVDAVILDRRDGWSFGKLDDEAHWQDFAVGFLRATPSSQQAPPDPYQFDRWEDWAERAYSMLEVTS